MSEMAWLLPIHSFRFVGGNHVTGKLITYAKCDRCDALFQEREDGSIEPWKVIDGKLLCPNHDTDG
jgi:hypothetical protein